LNDTVFKPMHLYGAVFDSYKALESFQVIHTSHSCQFRAPGRDKIILTDAPLSFKALGMMRTLKKEVRERLPKLILDYDTTYYFGFRNIAGQGECNEYDLEHAYLTALYELGAITDALYQKLNTEVKKKERLAVVGSLATNRLIIDYSFEEKTSQRRERDPELLKVWKTITFKVDQKIRSWFLGDQGSMFYWVDALFTKSEMNIPGTKTKRCEYEAGNKTIRFKDNRYFPIMHSNRGDAWEPPQKTPQTPAI